MSTHTQQGLIFAHTNWGSGGSRDRTWQFWPCAEPTCKYALKNRYGHSRLLKSREPAIVWLGWGSVSMWPWALWQRSWVRSGNQMRPCDRQHCPTSTTPLWMKASCLLRASGWCARNWSICGMEQKCLACTWVVARRATSPCVVGSEWRWQP